MPERLNRPKRFETLSTFFLFVFLVLLVTKDRISLAQTGLASTYTLDDAEAVDGDLLCLKPESGSLVRCHEPYDERLFGVLSKNAQVVLRADAQGDPIVREGRTRVNVAVGSDPIKPGDYITSSTTPGKGQKAVESQGFVVGRALAGLEGGSGQVEVALAIGPATIAPRGNILDQIGLALLKNVQKPSGAALFMRYVTAGLLAILVTWFAFSNFGKNIGKGVEAVGRNPLARHEIQLMVALNIILVAAITLGGMILSILIIRF